LLFIVFSLLSITLAMVWQMASILFKNRLYIISAIFNLAAGLLILLELILISIEIRMVAITNMYEALLFFTACIQITLAIFLLKGALKKSQFIPIIGNFFCVLLILLAISPLFFNKDYTIPEALRSFWLVIHVSLAIIGDALFFMGFIASLLFLIYKNPQTKQQLDKLAYFSIIIGYMLFTLGALIFGAIWAQQAWGRYWGWDAKEIWALITWLTYSAYLHLRIIMKAKPKILALVAIIGFVFTIFTFLGVNFLFRGLHSY